jgi:colicin import membrane protein
VIGSTDHEVTIRLDAEDARVDSWPVSTDHTATFYTGDTKALLDGLARAKKLVGRTTPQGESAVMATFNVSGFANVVPDILKTCGKIQLKMRKEQEASKAEDERRLKEMGSTKAKEEKLRKEIEIAKAEEEKLRKEIEVAKAEEEKRRNEIELAKAKAEEEQRQKASEAAKALDAQRLLEEQAQSEKLRKDARERALKLAGTAVSSGDPNTSGLANSNVAPSSDYGAKLRAAIRPNILSFKDLSPGLAAEYLVQTDTTALIVSAKLAKSSGNAYWDDVALKAILKTERLPKDIDGRTPSSIMLILRPQD